MEVVEEDSKKVCELYHRSNLSLKRILYSLYQCLMMILEGNVKKSPLYAPSGLREFIWVFVVVLIEKKLA